MKMGEGAPVGLALLKGNRVEGLKKPKIILIYICISFVMKVVNAFS